MGVGGKKLPTVFAVLSLSSSLEENGEGEML